MSHMRVAIVGSGQFGRALGIRLSKQPCVRLIYGSRNPEAPKVQQLLAELGNDVKAAAVHDAVLQADVIILATPGLHRDEDIQQRAAYLGPHTAGKVLIDVTNPLTEYPESRARWAGQSGAEVLAAALPGTHVFKAFNSICWTNIMAPDGSINNGQQLTCMYAGGPEGQQLAERVISAVGFQPMHLGPLRYAAHLEVLAELYVHVACGAGTAAQWPMGFHFQVLPLNPAVKPEAANPGGSTEH